MILIARHEVPKQSPNQCTLSLRGTKCRSNLQISARCHCEARSAEATSKSTHVVIARHEVPKQSPYKPYDPCHCEARSAEATSKSAHVVIARHEVPKQPPNQRTLSLRGTQCRSNLQINTRCHCEARSAEATSKSAHVVIARHAVPKQPP